MSFKDFLKENNSYEITDLSNIKSSFKNYLNSLVEKLSKETINSLNFYIDDSSNINSTLKDIKKISNAEQNIENHIVNIDGAFHEGILSKHGTYYRGMNKFEFMMSDNLDIGSVHVTTSFMSVSEKYDIAKRFAYSNHIFQINFKRSSKTKMIDILRNGLYDIRKTYSHEKEHIIQRGSFFKVKSKTKKRSFTIYEIDLL